MNLIKQKKQKIEKEKVEKVEKEKSEKDNLEKEKSEKEKLEKDKLKKEKTLGEKIVEGRRNKGLSQEKFAEKMGCTRQMVSRWELDQSIPRTQKIKKISSILGIPIDELIYTNEENKKKQRKMKLMKLLSRKNIIRCLIILIIIVAAMYFLYSGYKLLVLNSISSRVAEYEHANNYHFVMEKYIDKKINEREEVWYKDGLYKITQTSMVNEVEDGSTIYIDINNKYRYIIDEENKKYSQINLFNSEQYDNGGLMYSLFPIDITNKNDDFKKLPFKVDKKVFAYLKNEDLYLIISNETLQFDKDTLLPISQTTVFTENQNKIENTIKYRIELNNVTDKDVKISDEYQKIN